MLKLYYYKNSTWLTHSISRNPNEWRGTGRDRVLQGMGVVNFYEHFKL